MKKIKIDPPEPEGFNMTPMIDIVFQLIIFFMLATELSKAQIEPLILPKAKVTENDIPSRDSTIIVNIKKTSGNARIIIMKQEFSGKDKLGQLFEDVSKSKGDYFINIRVDKGVDWGEVQRVLAVAQKKGNAKNVIISAETGK